MVFFKNFSKKNFIFSFVVENHFHFFSFSYIKKLKIF